MRIQSLHDLHLSFPDIDGFWNFQDLGQTESQIRAQMPSSEGPLKASEIEVVTQLARVHSLQGKLKEARDLLTLASMSLKNLNPEEKVRPEIRYFLEEGRIYCQSMFPSRALESFSQAWLHAKDTEHKVFAVDAAYMISITLPAKQGKEWLQKAIQIAENSQDPICRSWLTYLYMMEGWQAFDSHNFEKALIDFEKAYSDLKEADPNARTLKWCTARSLRALGQPEKSLVLQEEILSELDQLGQSNGHVFLEIAECYQALQDQGRARSYFEMAFENLKKDKWYSDNYDNELSRMQRNAKKPF